MFSLQSNEIPGLVIVKPTRFADSRGWFANLFTTSFFEKNGLNAKWVNMVCSSSKPGVLRGLHFQKPPLAQAKLVTCMAGSVLDVIVDLRAGSPTCGRYETIELSEENGIVLLVPIGLAHGFYVPSRESTVLYLISNDYSPQHEGGVLWSSIGLEWPFEAPVLSPKDQLLPKLRELESPFVFERAGDRD